jgi:hypothetical protein
MGVIDEFWSHSAGTLRANFERARISQTDPGIKGGANEQTLGDFLGDNIAARRIALKSSIIDSWGRRSDEVDVVVVNEYQPIVTGEREQLLIAEGVDAVYQSKARLSSDELKRAITNARTVKELIRHPGMGSVTFADQVDVNRFVNRIPYFVFGYTTNISKEATLSLLNGQLADTSHELLPDGVFLLDGWSIINIANNNGVFQTDYPGASGYVSLAGNSLAQMLWCHYTAAPHFVHLMHPIRHYKQSN